MAGKDGPPPTPEMMVARPILKRLTTPVTELLLSEGVSELKAAFIAVRAVAGVLSAIVADDVDVGFIVKHQSFLVSPKLK